VSIIDRRLANAGVKPMSLEYVCDDTKRRIRITLSEPFTFDDLVASVERQFADGAWRHGLLIDTRAPSHTPLPSEIRSFASRIAALVAVHGPRGPIAIVAKTASAVSSAQLAAFFGRVESIEVFWDLDDAEQWLDEQFSKTRKTPD
jgi:hypothetical protein